MNKKDIDDTTGPPAHCWSSSSSPSVSSSPSDMDVPVVSPLKVFLKCDAAMRDSDTPAVSSLSSLSSCSSLSSSSIDATSLDPSMTPLCPSSSTSSLDALKFNSVNTECTTVKELSQMAPTPIFSSLPGTISPPILSSVSSSSTDTVTCTSSCSSSLSSDSDSCIVENPRIPPLPPCSSSTTTTTTTTAAATTTTTETSNISSSPSPISSSIPPPTCPPSKIPRSPLAKPVAPSPRPTIALNGHRCVLAAHSKFFYMMFSNGMKESFEKEVKVYVEDVPSFEKMFEYFYTGIINFKDTNLLKLLELCIQFDVPRLCCDVSSYLSANLTLSNAFEVFEFARSRLGKTHPLFSKTVDYVLSNFFSKIFRGAPPSICHLSSASLRYLLKSDKLSVSMEYYAFMALRFWAEHTNAKESEIKDLLPYIRLAQIDVDRLRNLVRPSKLGIVCPELFKHYMTALEYHASSPEMQPYLPMCDFWKRKRESYKPPEFISFKWQFKWSGLTNWVYHWTHLQGYKLFATLGKHEDGTFGMYFVPSANEHKQFCLKAELKVYLTNKSNDSLCPELKLEPTIFKSDSKTPLNSIAKGWATKIDPTKLVDDVIVMKIKARICES